MRVMLLLAAATLSCAFSVPARACSPHLARVKSPARRGIPALAAAAIPLNEPTISEVLYDGQCMVCLTNKAVLTFFEKIRKQKRLSFVNIRDPGYTPSEHAGISFEDAMRHFHVITGTEIAEGSDAVLTAYSRVGLGWVMGLLRLPIIRWLVNGLYHIVSKYRYQISQFLPGGKRLASAVSGLNDMQTAAEGGGCDDEEECMLDYDEEDK